MHPSIVVLLAVASILLGYAAALGAHEASRIGPTSVLQPTVMPNDPCFTGNPPCSGNGQWNLRHVRAPEAWYYTTGTDATVIAVLDTGVDLSHRDLADKLWVNLGEVPDDGLDNDNNGYVDDVHGYDFANDDADPSDDVGRGTLLAGIAAAATDNGAGVAGAAWGPRIMALKVLNLDSGPESWRWLAEGIRYAADKQARIILVGYSYLASHLTQEMVAQLADVVQYAHEHGALVVAPVGDVAIGDPPDELTYPAALDHVIGVTAVDHFDQRLISAQRSEFVDIAAPGWRIWGPYSPDPSGYAHAQGTNFAAPQVAGLAALAWAIDAAQTNPDAIWGYIKAGAAKVGNEPYDENGWNQFYGYGRIDALDTLLHTPHWLQIRPGSLTFHSDGVNITPPVHYITNTTSSAGAWIASADAGWLVLEGPTGKTPSHLEVSVAADHFPQPACGAHTANIEVHSSLPLAPNSPRIVEVLLRLPACTIATPTISPTPTASLTPTVSPTPTASPSPTITETPVPPPTVITPVTTPTIGNLLYLPLLTRDR